MAATPLSRSCPIRIISVHLLVAPGFREAVAAGQLHPAGACVVRPSNRWFGALHRLRIALPARGAEVGLPSGVVCTRLRVPYKRKTPSRSQGQEFS
jgi:hypothetical protein